MQKRESMLTKLSSHLIVLIGLTFLFTGETFAQGCSDAGVCTVHSFKPNGLDSVSENLNQFKVGASIRS